MKIIGIIPCRYRSTRFPGKPLAMISGKPMVWHVWSQTKKSKRLHRIVVATDDDLIYNVCQEYGIEVIMTSSLHLTGTDRVAEVAKQIEGEVFVNIQGDEPLIDPHGIDQLISMLIANREIQIINAYSCIDDASDIVNSNIVKVITSNMENALAYSRSPIPHPKNSKPIYKRQIGLYAFRRNAILKFSALPVGNLESSEGVEMFRYLENGYTIKMIEIDERGSIPVDEPGDILRVEKLIALRGEGGN